MSDEVLFEGIRALIVEQMGVKPGQVTMDTRLGQDLGIDGEDAYELLVQYKDRFNVNLDEFPYDDYFGPELPFNPIYWLFWRLVDKSKLELEELTVRELVETAKNRKWTANSDSKESQS